MSKDEYTGGSVSYYTARIETPTSGGQPYDAECNDIIESLCMNYAEGNAFKAIWRMCAARKGMAKKGYSDGLYDAEKVVFFGERMIAQFKAKNNIEAESATIEAKDDTNGWIPYKSGPESTCPLDYDCPIQIKLSSGTINEGYSLGTRWFDRDTDVSSIVEYRIMTDA